jgi:hypothetical protein
MQMRGHPTVPATDEHRVRRAMIHATQYMGRLGRDFYQLDEALGSVFDTDVMQPHVAKLRRTQADEHHLFLVVDVYDLDFSLFDALGSGDRLPDCAPALPDGLTHLWLAPLYGHRVPIGTPAGWAETRDIRPLLATEVSSES